MKTLTMSLIGAAILAVAILGFGGAATAVLPDVSGPNSQSVQMIGKHIDLRTAIQGRVSEMDTYQTTDTLAVVLPQYVGHYEPEPGQHKPGQCVSLRQTNSHFVLHQTELVTLCPAGNGTQIVVYRDLYLGW